MPITGKFEVLYADRGNVEGNPFSKIVCLNVDAEDTDGDYERVGVPLTRINCERSVIDDIRDHDVPGVFEVELDQRMSSKGVNLRVTKIVNRVGDIDLKKHLRGPVIDKRDTPSSQSAKAS